MLKAEDTTTNRNGPIRPYVLLVNVEREEIMWILLFSRSVLLQMERNEAKFRRDLTQHLTNKMVAILPGFKAGEPKVLRVVERQRSLTIPRVVEIFLIFQIKWKEKMWVIQKLESRNRSLGSKFWLSMRLLEWGQITNGPKWASRYLFQSLIWKWYLSCGFFRNYMTKSLSYLALFPYIFVKLYQMHTLLILIPLEGLSILGSS